MKRFLVAAAVCFLLVAVTAGAGAEVSTTFYGYTWLRYTFVDNVTSAENMFSIPRCYIGAKIKTDSIAEGLVLLNLESKQYGQSQVSHTDTNTLAASSALADWLVYLKCAYVDLKGLLPVPGMKIRFGLQGVYFCLTDLWGYPVTAREVADVNGLMSSADMGVALIGDIAEGRGDYQIAVYNGTGYKLVEDDPKKAVAVSLKIKPLPIMWVRGSYFADFANTLQAPVNKQRIGLAAGFDIPVLSGHFGYVIPSDPSVATVKQGRAMELFLLGRIPGSPFEFGCKYDSYKEDVSSTAAAATDNSRVSGGLNWQIAENVLMQFDVENKMYDDTTKNRETSYIVQTKLSW